MDGNGKNMIEDYAEFEKNRESLNEKIRYACRKFVKENLPSCQYEGWRFNDRKTLIIVDYSYGTTVGDIKCDSVCASFSEIECFIDNN